ncbi:MAG TPA: hypothetical protein VHZ99_07755 [Steroidobacteraceae bacterium]|jgi:hypothetical protein|nr:hypothetical protein [Steroidobacteraceae bacterium]
MTGEQTGGQMREGSDFERRTRAVLLDSAERLPGSVRSRLTQARHAALAARASGEWSSSRARRWVPAGALASVIVALFVALTPHGATTPARVAQASASLEDIDMLNDADGISLNGDQDVDFDFYEWAADEASNGSASMGS